MGSKRLVYVCEEDDSSRTFVEKVGSEYSQISIGIDVDRKKPKIDIGIGGSGSGGPYYFSLSPEEAKMLSKELTAAIKKAKKSEKAKK